MQFDSNKQLLTAVELAEKLAVKESWVRWQSHRKTIPVVRLGKYRRYVLDQVVQSLQEKGLHDRQ